MNSEGKAAPRRLNIGCGNQVRDGWIGIDKVATPAAHIVRDITRGLPFDDASVDEIYCDNVLEHIGPSEDFIFVLNEFYRVLKPGAVATIIVPDARSQAGWQDPTHERAFVPRSALYWNQDRQWPKLYGITANFDVAIEEYGNPDAEAFLKFVCTARPRTQPS
ncbi:MAG: methyltransferase domain-containing protein [Acidobacteria bacterium]|nr:methyltransferase domain-containing protein [Acidobacteriota bacterium]